VHVEAHGTVICVVVSCLWVWGSSVGWWCSSDDVAARGVAGVRLCLVSTLNWLRETYLGMKPSTSTKDL
jgi:hypothetical protein